MIEEFKVDRVSEEITNELFSLIDRQEYEKARILINKILEEYPECAEAYLGLLLIDMGYRSVDDLYFFAPPSPTDENFRKALLYSEGELREELEGVIDSAENHIKLNKIEFTERDSYLELTGGKGEYHTVNIPSGYKGKIIKKIGFGAFDKNIFIEYVEIPPTVTDIDSCAFRDCANLDCILIPDSVRSIGSYVFSGCRRLRGLTFPN